MDQPRTDRPRTDRRTFVAGAAIGVAAVAGCIAAPGDPAGEPTDGNGTDDPPEGDGSDVGNAKSGAGEYEVDLRDGPLVARGDRATLELELVESRIEPDSPAVLEATVAASAGESVSVFSGAPWPFGVVWLRPSDDEEPSADDVVTLWTDAYAEGEDSDHVGTDGRRVTEVEDVGLVRDLGVGDAVTRTFELHADAPGLEAGTFEGELGVRIEPAGDDGDDGGERLSVPVELAVERAKRGRPTETVVEEPRVDEPPYPIEQPDPPGVSSPGDWNEDYLGESMPTTPSLPFEPLQDVRLADPALSIRDDVDGRYAVRTILDANELAAVVDLDGIVDAVRDRLESIDFGDELLVIVESGFGSSSVQHRWRRVEEVADGVHLRGYYTRGYMGTTDYTTRRSAVIVERPEAFELARVSLTVREDRRVHFNSTEGPVAVEE